MEIRTTMYIRTAWVYSNVCQGEIFASCILILKSVRLSIANFCPFNSSIRHMPNRKQCNLLLRGYRKNAVNEDTFFVCGSRDTSKAALQQWTCLM